MLSFECEQLELYMIYATSIAETCQNVGNALNFRSEGTMILV